MAKVGVRIQHNSMQFSDSHQAHVHDARAIFDRARDKDVWIVTGTEASDSRTNHDLRDALAREAKSHDYYGYFHKNGDWVAVSREHFRNPVKGYMGPFIPATRGISSDQGAHAARGITLVGGRTEVGQVTAGCAHFLTQASIARSGSNVRLIRGIKAFGAKYGAGKSLVFFNADTNTNDKAKDVFVGIAPFTSVADELAEYYATWGKDKHHGAVIDVISSYDTDGRVKAKSYNVLDDSDLKLYTDHFVLDAIYEVSQPNP